MSGQHKGHKAGHLVLATGFFNKNIIGLTAATAIQHMSCFAKLVAFSNAYHPKQTNNAVDITSCALSNIQIVFGHLVDFGTAGVVVSSACDFDIGLENVKRPFIMNSRIEN